MADLHNLMTRRQRAVGELERWRSILDKVYTYAAPNKNVWRDTGGQGQKPVSRGNNLTAHLYDLTLLIGTRSFVNRLTSALIPKNEQWLRFVPGSTIDEESRDTVARLLQDLTDFFFRTINASNFYLAVPEAFEDCAVSTGALQINEGDDDEPLVFSSVPSNSIAYEAGVDGTYSGYFRDFVGISINEILSYWPDATISSELYKLESDCLNKNDKKIHLVEATIYNYQTKMWDTTIFELNLKEVLYEMEEEAPAFVAFRWNRRSGEVLGRGPAMDAMPAAASINEAMRDELIAAAFKANPMYMAYSGNVVNYDTFRVEPGAILPVLPTSSGSWPLAPVPNAGDINFAVLVVQDLREQINRLMFTNPLGPIDTPRQTATESLIRATEFAENAAASFSRVQREFFDKVVKRIIYILKKRGEWPRVEIDGKEIDIKYETPLSASKGQKEVEKLVLFNQILAGMMGPEAAAAATKSAKLPFFIAENLNVDLDLVSSEKEIIEALQKAQAQMQAQTEGQAPGMVAPPQEELGI